MYIIEEFSKKWEGLSKSQEWGIVCLMRCTQSQWVFEERCTYSGR
jgi:hypothetical protein